MKRVWRLLVRVVVVLSFLVSGTVVVLWVRTLDGRVGRFDSVTEGWTYFRFMSTSEGMLFAWASPWPKDYYVRWREAGDRANWLTGGVIGEGLPLDQVYWLEEDGKSAPVTDAGPSVRRGTGYVYWGGAGAPIGKPRWVRVHLPHGMVAGVAAVPAVAFAARAALRWDRTRRRARAGLCLACGYDLRGSAGRCPECGEGVGGGGDGVPAGSGARTELTC